MFSNFYGNPAAADTLARMAGSGRIPQTILLEGPEGVGKATLARTFAGVLMGKPGLMERDDLSLQANAECIAEREKWPADQRNDDPLLFASHPDFVTFPPDGPLRQISIQQMRLLKDRARYKPLQGTRRVFLIDHIDRANEQAANSLLKTLEEPPEHLVLILTAENPYDLLPTIRSRAVSLHLSPLHAEEMRAFLRDRNVPDADLRLALAGGSPGLAVAMDIEVYVERRAAMLALLQAAAGRAPFAEWAKYSEGLAARKQDRLELLMGVLYGLLEDIVLLANGCADVRNADMRGELEPLASAVSFRWIRAAVRRADEMVEFGRRNIQKSIALDAFAVELRGTK